MEKKALNLFLIIALPFFACAQAKLTSLENSYNSNKFYTQSENVQVFLTINGENIGPDYMDLKAAIARIKVCALLSK